MGKKLRVSKSQCDALQRALHDHRGDAGAAAFGGAAASAAAYPW